MALNFPHDCPYCKTKAIAYSSRYEWRVPNDGYKKLILATCNGCSGGVIFLFSLTQHTADYLFQNASGDLKVNGIATLKFWPGEVSGDTPEDVPENVARLFDQSLTCIRQQAWDAAGMTLRKTLEVSTKGLDPTLAAKTLAARIDALHATGRLTSDIAAWAHEIRLDGNQATHEEEPFTADQVSSLHNFVEAYLRYIYSLPAMVARSRAQRAAA